MAEIASPKTDAEWRAEQDAQTLAEANVILSDDKRLKAAKKAATKLAKNAADNLAGLLKVAGKLNNTFEGMRILDRE